MLYHRRSRRLRRRARHPPRHRHTPPRYSRTAGLPPLARRYREVVTRPADSMRRHAGRFEHVLADVVVIGLPGHLLNDRADHEHAGVAVAVLGTGSEHQWFLPDDGQHPGEADKTGMPTPARSISASRASNSAPSPAPRPRSAAVPVLLSAATLSR